MTSDSTVRPALVLMSGRGIAFAASFLLPVALVRLFDPAAFGTYKQLFLLYTTLYVVGSVVAESLFYFLPRTPAQAGRYAANALLALAATGIAFFGLLVFAAPALARGLGNADLRRHLPWLGAFLALMLPSVCMEIVMIARRRYRWGAVAYGTSDVLRVLALLVPAAAAAGLRGLLLGALAFAAARLAGTLLYFRHEFGAGLRPQRALYREQVAYALPFALTVVVETLQVNYHQYAVAHHVGAATFAIYAVGCFQIPLLELVASPLANVMMVRMAERIRDGRGEEAAGIWAGTARALALVFFPVLALLLVCAPDLIVFLFTDAYRASVPVFAIWSLAIALSVLPTEAVLRVYAATRLLLALSALRLLLIATLIGPAITAFGLRGAVLVTVGAAVPAKAAALLRMSRLMRVPVSRLLPWPALLGIAAASAACALPALGARLAVTGPAASRLLVTGVVYATFYLLALFHAGLLSGEEKQALLGRLGRWPTPAPAGGPRTS